MTRHGSILVIDDEEIMREILETLLVREGYQVRLATNGTQGIELLNWVAARGALTGQVSELHRNYHIPISNTAAGLMLFDNRD